MVTIQNPQSLETKLNEGELLTEDLPNIWSDTAKNDDKRVSRFDFQVIVLVLFFFSNESFQLLQSYSICFFFSLNNRYKHLTINHRVFICSLHHFQVDPESSQLPQLTVLLYYVHNGTEMIADSVKVRREVCSPNKVELKFSETVIQPGAFVDMILSASPNSQCGYEIVDRSVKLLSGSETNPFLK